MAIRHWVKLRKDHYKSKTVPHSEIWATQYRTNFSVRYNENMGLGIEILGSFPTKKDSHAFIMEYIRSHTN